MTTRSPLSGARSLASRAFGTERRKQYSVHARLSAIEQRLDDIDGRLNHWVGLLEDLNHGVADIQGKLGDAAADVEMTAAMLMATERRIRQSAPPED